MERQRPSAPPGSGGEAPEIEAEAHDLIRLSQVGDEDAFRRLVERYQGRAYWAAYHLVHDAEDARDIAQEAFIRVFRSLDRFDFKYRFYTWLYQIVVNLAIDHLRRRRGAGRSVSLGDVAEIASEDSGPSGRLERAEKRRAVEQVLATLPDKQRALIVLRDVEGLSSKEIADILGCNHATVRWRLHRARVRFRQLWESRHGET